MPWHHRLRLELRSSARCHVTLQHCAGQHPWIPWLSWHHFRDLCRGFLQRLYPREHLVLRVLGHLFLHRHFQFLPSASPRSWISLDPSSHHPSVSRCLSLSWASRLPSAAPCSRMFPDPSPAARCPSGFCPGPRTSSPVSRPSPFSPGPWSSSPVSSCLP